MYERNKSQDVQLFSNLLMTDTISTGNNDTLFIDLHHWIQHVFKPKPSVTPITHKKSMFTSPEVVTPRLFKDEQRENAVAIIESLSSYLSTGFINIVIFTHFIFDEQNQTNCEHMNQSVYKYFVDHYEYQPYISSSDRQPVNMQSNMYLFSELISFVIKNAETYASNITIVDSTMILTRCTGLEQFTVASNNARYTLPGFEVADRVINYYMYRKLPIHLSDPSDLTLSLIGLRLELNALRDVYANGRSLISDKSIKRIESILTRKMQQFGLEHFPLDMFLKSLCLLSALSYLGFESGDEYMRPPSFQKLFISYMKHRQVFKPLITCGTTICGKPDFSIDNSTIIRIIEIAIMNDKCTQDFNVFFERTKNEMYGKGSENLYNKQVKYQSVLSIISFIDNKIIVNSIHTFVTLLKKFME